MLVNYWINLKGHGDSHPTKSVLQASWEKEKAQKFSFGWIGDETEAARDLRVSEKQFCPTVVWPDFPIWKIETMEVDFKWHWIKTINKSADLVAEFYRYVDDKYRDYIQIYTDGSNDPESGITGSAIFIVNQEGEESKRTTVWSKCVYSWVIRYHDGIRMD